MKIDPAKFDEYKHSFLKYFPKNEGFDQPDYLERERSYKQELRDIFQGELLTRLRALPADTEDLFPLAEDLLGLFTRPLQWNNKKPQNLVGWQYTSFARRIDKSEKVKFVTEVARLVDEHQPIEERIDRFYSSLEDIADSVGQKVGDAMKRSMATFFLFMSEPEKYIFVKAREFGRAVKDLAGQRLYGQADEYSKLLEFAYSVRDGLTERGLKPRDLIDVQSFLWVHQSYQDEDPVDRTVDDDGTDMDVIGEDIALNQILYGPPGTGKTYRTINKALAILDPAFLASNADNRAALKKRFDELRENGRVDFVTFHQSFSYEDFVEGLRASVDDEGQVVYEIEEGIFKRMCKAAEAKATVSSPETVDVSGKRIWKMSLGNTRDTSTHIFDECMQENRILLGYGSDIDFSGASTRKEVVERFKRAGKPREVGDYPVTSVNTFINTIRIGDLVVVSEGNRKFRAIGEVTGQYEVLDDAERGGYLQSRAVKWLRVYEPSLPYDQLMNNVFSQMTLYELKPGSINLAKLKALLETGDSFSYRKRPFVEGEEIKSQHVVSKITDDLIWIRRPNGVDTPIAWEMLEELAGLVQAGKIDLSNIGEKTIFDGVETRLDKYIVNGYRSFLPAIIMRIVKNASSPRDKGLDTKRPRVLIVDEINRGNIASILGELITLIEPSKRAGQPESLEITLPYSKEKFSVPDNLYIIGTMNTADRSLTHIDTALRRRFEFEPMLPDIDVLRDLGIDYIDGIDVPRMLSVMNKRIEVLYDREHTLGHSFFIPLEENPSLETLEKIFRTSILPLLEEYFFEDWARIRQILADDRKQDKTLMFYLPSFSDSDIEQLLGDDSPGNLSEKIFRRNASALRSKDSYVGIYQKSESRA